ncbi:carbonic anhydrase [Planosporangium thailandense]|uniref:carbonic anhydrase n=1 Tax=Planosporangium thailandense TaxID=765197 RepID=UPI001F0DA099|nr:carbonic anhydrase [Planosporangium thailandense]
MNRSGSTRDATPRPAFDAETPLARLLAGNQRFVAGKPRFGHHVDAPGARTTQHRPWACVVGCLDSRVPPEAVLDQDFGSVVVVRTGGHVLDEAGIGSVEFAVSVFEVPLVLVLGHQYCGAVTSAVRALDGGDHPGGAVGRLVDDIAAAIDPTDDPAHRVDRAIDRHVARTVSVLSELASTRDRIAAGTLEIVGARYQIDTGRVTVLG